MGLFDLNPCRKARTTCDEIVSCVRARLLSIVQPGNGIGLQTDPNTGIWQLSLNGDTHVHNVGSDNFETDTPLIDGGITPPNAHLQHQFGALSAGCTICVHGGYEVTITGPSPAFVTVSAVLYKNGAVSSTGPVYTVNQYTGIPTDNMQTAHIPFAFCVPAAVPTTDLSLGFQSTITGPAGTNAWVSGAQWAYDVNCPAT